MSWVDKLLAELGPTRDKQWEEIKHRSKEALERMTPLERAIMYEEQRLDFAYGNTKLSNPAITREMVHDARDRQDRVVRSDT